MSHRTPEEIVAEYRSEFAAMGGRARAAKLSPERRRAIAHKAAKASAKSRKAKKRNEKKETEK